MQYCRDIRWKISLIPQPKGSADLIEDRRHRTLALLDEKRSINEVERRINCAANSVTLWRGARKRRGTIEVRFSPGRP